MKKISIVICVAILALFIVFSGKLNDIVSKIQCYYQKDNDVEYARDFDTDESQINEPQVIDEVDISERLKELVSKYPKAQAIYDNSDNYSQEMLKAVCNNPEMIEFVLGYPNSDGEVSGGITASELKEKVPLLIQWDERWGYVTYNNSNIGMAGCGPTCLSMVAVALTGKKEHSPDMVADYAVREGYCSDGTGTSWNLMTEGSTYFGIQGREISLDKNVVITELESNHPIICSVRPGDFTTTGHFIVLAGTKDGKIIVNDPNSRIRSNKLWEFDDIMYQIKNLWAFE